MLEAVQVHSVGTIGQHLFDQSSRARAKVLKLVTLHRLLLVSMGKAEAWAAGRCICHPSATVQCPTSGRVASPSMDKQTAGIVMIAGDVRFACNNYKKSHFAPSFESWRLGLYSFVQQRNAMKQRNDVLAPLLLLLHPGCIQQQTTGSSLASSSIFFWGRTELKDWPDKSCRCKATFQNATVINPQ